MSDPVHPIKAAPKIAFQAIIANEAGPAFVGFIHPHSRFPLIFSASTLDELHGKIDDFVTKTCDEYEAAYISRIKAQEKAKATRAAKKEAK